jgi:predicted porin
MDGSTAGPTIGQNLSQRDFESRYDRLRYDSPKLGPVVLSVSTGVKGDNDVTELGARLNTDLGGDSKLVAAIGFSSEDKETINPSAAGDEETIGRFISRLSGFGLNLTAAASKLEDDAANDASYSYFKIGYKAGMHAAALGCGVGEDQAAAGDEVTTIDVEHVFKPHQWAELYASYEINELDRDGASFDDISIFTVGTRLKF